MTEAEAKTKWCPFVRYNDHGANRWTQADDVVGARTACIASACMAWRWIEPHQENVYQKERPEGEGWQESKGAKNGWWWRQSSADNGFCGLAGMPK